MSSTESNPATIANFYKGDVIELSPKYYAPVEVAVENRTMFVHETSADGSSVTAVRPLKGSWPMYSSFQSEHVRLVRRGNHFYYEHGLNDRLDFRGDIVEEATFWIDVKQAHEVPNINGRYRGTWSRDEALRALNDGDIDAVFVSSSSIAQESLVSAYRFVDREIGERFRRIMLLGERELIPSAA